MDTGGYHIDHVHIYSDDIDQTVNFYVKTFGAVELRRIDSLVHLSLGSIRLVVSKTRAERPAGLGHFALGGDGLLFESAKSQLSHVAISDLRVVEGDSVGGESVRYENFFIRDPTSGVTIEIISPLTK